MDAFTNKSHKTKYFEDINYNKIVTLEVRVRGYQMSGLVWSRTSHKDVPSFEHGWTKHLCVPEFIKYTGTQYPATHLKSYCNKMAEVMHDKKIIDALLSGQFEWGISKLVHKTRQQKDPKMERPRGCFHQATIWILFMIDRVWLF